jgi:nicotinate-nucleotide pyrophosphorylase (carboxylating)
LSAGQAVVVAPHLDPPRSAVVDLVERALAEDLTPLGDLTSSLVPADAVATARLVARRGGVLAGRATAAEVFHQVDPAIRVDWSCSDGDRVERGTVIAEVTGRLRSVLTAERTALNVLGHLSGVATETRRYVDAVAAAGGTARVWDTRKTTPGLRSLEKAAVRAGGGANHRGNLSDWVLLKDNHLALLGIEAAVDQARRDWPARTVHVECDRLDQVDEALAAGVDAILLDNMTTTEVAAAVVAADAHTAAHGGRRPLLEVSGEVTVDTIGDYAVLGVDCISVGAITKSAPVLDVGLDVDPVAAPSFGAPDPPAPT